MKQELNQQTLEWYSKVGKQIRKLRKEETGLSAEEFAKEVDISRNCYFKMERGEGEYYLSNLLKVLSHYPRESLSSFWRDFEFYRK